MQPVQNTGTEYSGSTLQRTFEGMAVIGETLLMELGFLQCAPAQKLEIAQSDVSSAFVDSVCMVSKYFATGNCCLFTYYNLLSNLHAFRFNCSCSNYIIKPRQSRATR